MSGQVAPEIFYTRLQRRLHWVVILLLAGQYLLQGFMRDALKAIESEQTLGFGQFLVTTIHTWSGISIAMIMIWRWQLRKRQVPLNGGNISKKFERWARVHHVSLYVTVWVMALSGSAHYYLHWQQAARWHELGKWVLLGLILLHVAGALVHAAKGNTVLRLMMGRGSVR